MHHDRKGQRRPHQPFLAALTLALVCSACAGSGSEIKPEEWRSRLRTAMRQEVPTRQRRDELSRVLADAAAGGELVRMSRLDVQAAFGEGLLCESLPLCDDQGFQSSDWYYLIGVAGSDKIKQLPVLILGFDPHGRVSRVYTLTTH